MVNEFSETKSLTLNINDDVLADKHTQILSAINSSSRRKILSYIMSNRSGRVRLKDLAEICGVTVQEVSRQIIRLEECGLVVRYGPSYVKLSEVGYVILKYVESIHFLVCFEEYLNKHDLSAIPMPALMMLNEIKEAELKTGFGVAYKLTLEIARSAQRELVLVVPTTNLFKQLLIEVEESGSLKRLSNISAFIPAQCMEDGLDEVATICDITFTPRPLKFILIKNEECAILALPTKEGEIDSDSCLKIGKYGFAWINLILELLKSRDNSQ